MRDVDVKVEVKMEDEGESEDEGEDEGEDEPANGGSTDSRGPTTSTRWAKCGMRK
ncbi:MAG: hypothetical protein H6972_13420 [Gammaproteobacteria bacterium]|nr:hypothetical protein [Gammaproteobacteria bacterium]